MRQARTVFVLVPCGLLAITCCLLKCQSFTCLKKHPNATQTFWSVVAILPVFYQNVMVHHDEGVSASGRMVTWLEQEDDKVDRRKISQIGRAHV